MQYLYITDTLVMIGNNGMNSPQYHISYSQIYS